MTSLADLIENGIVTPNEHGSSLIWWAYIHSHDNTIKVKSWWPQKDTGDDLAYAKQEKKEGNDFILEILDKPFIAKVNKAHERARELIRDQLLLKGLWVSQDPARNPPFYLSSIKESRFKYLELD